MTIYPDVARKAQAELDAVIGQDRLPSFSDRDNLPYINAIVLEVLRWHAVVPTSKTLALWFRFYYDLHMAHQVSLTA